MKLLKDIVIDGKPVTELTYEWRDSRIVVHGWGVQQSGTLEGKPLKQYLDSFTTIEEALAQYPDAEPSHPEQQPNLY
ncbi:hypothetical protein [Vibrio agarivorans]|uniref:hypothetical protein n=1 Tax=Vibrio agarivorans TaxID=153622 RepID=UPI0025B5164F|nr:hypothetical protein [Vibrio agarivorans]MDN3661134.1 hypothetical protein [Vibrio agarivorans]